MIVANVAFADEAVDRALVGVSAVPQHTSVMKS